MFVIVTYIFKTGVKRPSKYDNTKFEYTSMSILNHKIIKIFHECSPGQEYCLCIQRHSVVCVCNVIYHKRYLDSPTTRHSKWYTFIFVPTKSICILRFTMFFLKKDKNRPRRTTYPNCFWHARDRRALLQIEIDTLHTICTVSLNVQ